MASDTENRRPLKSRDTGWARRIAAALAQAGVSPDQVSAASIVFGLLGGGLFVASGLTDGPVRVVVLMGAGVAVQLRLLCNLMDGLVAVEHGRGGPLGPIWNELPDRVADGLLLVGAGYGAALAGADWAEPAGWAAACFAVLTAYVRELGRALGQPADFCGPMAKPRRMAVLTVGAVAATAEPSVGWRGELLATVLTVIAVGTALTALRRTLRLAARLKGGAP